MDSLPALGSEVPERYDARPFLPSVVLRAAHIPDGHPIAIGAALLPGGVDAARSRHRSAGSGRAYPYDEPAPADVTAGRRYHRRHPMVQSSRQRAGGRHHDVHRDSAVVPEYAAMVA